MPWSPRARRRAGSDGDDGARGVDPRRHEAGERLRRCGLRRRPAATTGAAASGRRARERRWPRPRGRRRRSPIAIGPPRPPGSRLGEMSASATISVGSSPVRGPAASLGSWAPGPGPSRVVRRDHRVRSRSSVRPTLGSPRRSRRRRPPWGRILLGSRPPAAARAVRSIISSTPSFPVGDRPEPSVARVGAPNVPAARTRRGTPLTIGRWAPHIRVGGHAAVALDRVGPQAEAPPGPAAGRRRRRRGWPRGSAAPASRQAGASKGSATPMARARAGISWSRPRAPTGDSACGSKPLSAFTTAPRRAGSMPCAFAERRMSRGDLGRGGAAAGRWTCEAMAAALRRAARARAVRRMASSSMVMASSCRSATRWRSRARTRSWSRASRCWLARTRSARRSSATCPRPARVARSWRARARSEGEVRRGRARRASSSDGPPIRSRRAARPRSMSRVGGHGPLLLGRDRRHRVGQLLARQVLAAGPVLEHLLEPEAKAGDLAPVIGPPGPATLTRGSDPAAAARARAGRGRGRSKPPTRTTSRIERMPASSEPSKTRTWRTPCLTITAAASAIGHSGAAVTTSPVMWSSTYAAVGVEARRRRRAAGRAR